MANLLIGTSGWTSSSWRGRFYPEELPSSKYLEFYSRYFSATEVNYSFYHLPKQSTYQKWKEQSPPGFLFALKASRLITHTRQLLDVELAWHKFLENAIVLSDNLGPILFQFPGSFHLDMERLESFLDMVEQSKTRVCKLDIVFEFRHKSWFTRGTYDLLKAYGAGLCIADSPRYPRVEIVTGRIAYFRYHGRTNLFASSYSRAELKEEALKIKKLLQQNIDVYAFFNNDARGYAIQNAKTLQRILRGADSIA